MSEEKKPCHMWREHPLKKKWECVALTEWKNCGPDCPFHKTKDEQLEIERRIYSKFRKKYPEYAKKYVSAVTGKRFYEMSLAEREGRA